MSALCQILEPTGRNIDACVEQLRAGDVIGVPAETVYGLAGNALAEKSVRKIFSVKGRPLIDPLIVHFRDPSAALPYVEVSESFRKLAGRFWPGPMTLVVTKKKNIPDLVTAGLSSVAIRIPAHPVFHRLLQRLDCPLAAPSANPFGYVSPTRAEHVRDTLGERIASVLDGGPCRHGLESTIIDLRNPESVPVILRHGPITQGEIEDCLGRKIADRPQCLEPDTAPRTAPGMRTRHYSPHAAVDLADGDSELAEQPKNPKTARIYQRKPANAIIDRDDYWFSEDGDLETVARNLFALIRRLDQLDYVRIHIAKAPRSGIGPAINDRLTRAAAPESEADSI